MSNARRTGPFRDLLLTSTALVAALSGGGKDAEAANGLSGFQVQAGSATLSTPSATQSIIRQSSNKAILNWSAFGIPSGSSVQFVQPGAGSIALNRVTGGSASQILGSLSANGQVWLVNPSGVFFGKGAQVDVAGLMATTADIRNADFLAGNYQFGIAGDPNASVVNQGRIRVASGGSAVLAGTRVDNQGLIEAQLGSVVLGGAKTFAVDFQGDKLLSFQVTSAVDQRPTDANGAPANALVTNEGTISASGGTVLITARAAKNIIDNVINSSGIVEATSVKSVNGEIILDGGDGGVTVTGSLDASGKGAGETGGTVKVLGGQVALASTANIDVSGDAGGGTALVGGNFHGAGPEANATTTTVSAGASINASAITTGDGGKVAVWSDTATSFGGTITATGGSLGGNGGFVETSGKSLSIISAAKVNTSAAKGTAGTWLLDPADFTIDSSTASAIVTDLVSSNVVVETNPNDATSGTGNIVVSAQIIYGSGNDLSLLAAGNILVNASIQNSQQGHGGSINLVAGWDGTTGISGGTVGINTSANSASAMIASIATTKGAFGSTALGGNVFINNATSSVGVSDGSATGPTVVLAHDVTLQGGSGSYRPATAQLGFAPSGLGQNTSGDIDVTATGNVALLGGSGGGASAQIGHGGGVLSLLQGPSPDVTLAGNITVSAAGSVLLQGGSNHGGAFAQIGHGGAGAFSGAYFSANSVLHSGNISVTAGANMTLLGGNRGAGGYGGGGNFAQIGHGGSGVGEHGSFGNFIESGTINVAVTGTLKLLGNTGVVDNIQEEKPGPGEPDGGEGASYAQIGHGGANFLASAQISGLGENIGAITVTATQAIVLAGAPNDLMSYAQIGHGGLQAFVGTSNGTKPAVLSDSGDISVAVGSPTTAGTLGLQGGGGALSYAMIGHGGMVDPAGTTTNADVTESGNITVAVGSASAEAAGQSILSLQGGTGATPADPSPTPTALWFTGGAFAQIGHGGLSGAPSTGSFTVNGDIAITVGSVGGSPGALTLAGGSDSNTNNYALIGHGGNGLLQGATINAASALAGNIGITVNGPVTLTGGTAAGDGAGIGAVLGSPGSGSASASGNIDLRSAGSLSLAGPTLIGHANGASGTTAGDVIIEASGFLDNGKPGVDLSFAHSIANDLRYGDVSLLDSSTQALLEATVIGEILPPAQPSGTTLNLVSAGSIAVTQSLTSGVALNLVAGWDGVTGLPVQPGSANFDAGALLATPSASGNHQGAISLAANLGTVNLALDLIGPVVLAPPAARLDTISTGSGPITVMGVVSGTGGLALPGSGIINFESAINLPTGTIDLSGKTGGSFTAAGHVDAAALLTGTGPYSLSLLAGGTIGDPALTNTGGDTLSGSFIFSGGLTVPGTLTLAGDTTLDTETSGIVLGPVQQGSNTFIVIADAVTLNGAWTGTGPRGLTPFSNLSIGLGGAPGGWTLTAQELQFIADPPKFVVIGAGTAIGQEIQNINNNPNSGFGTNGPGPINVGTFTFDAPLYLIGSSIVLQGTLSKTNGGVRFFTPGSISGAGSLNLGAGTGILAVGAGSADLNGTVNGTGGSAAAGGTTLVVPPGTGPYLINGVCFASAGCPAGAPPPIVLPNIVFNHLTTPGSGGPAGGGPTDTGGNTGGGGLGGLSPSAGGLGSSDSTAPTDASVDALSGPLNTKPPTQSVAKVQGYYVSLLGSMLMEWRDLSNGPRTATIPEEDNDFSGWGNEARW